MSRSQIGSVIYGLITVIPLQRIAHFYLFGALGTFSLAGNITDPVRADLFRHRGQSLLADPEAVSSD